MTMKVQEHTIVTKRERHPNDVRYPCRPTHEIIDCGRKFFDSLTREQQKLLIDKKLIIDESETAELYDSVLENDIIGLGIHRTFGGFTSNMYKVVKIHKANDYMECENVYSKEIEEISFQDFSVGLALNAAEILYREDKPFGVSTEQKITVKIHYEEKEEEASATETEQTTLPVEESAKATTKSSNPLLEDYEEEEDGSIDASAIAASATNAPAPEQAEAVEQTIKWTDLYYAFGVNQDDMTQYVILTRKDLWDKENRISDAGEADVLAKQLELETLMDSTYEYSHKYSESQLRMVFKAFQMTEKPEMIS